MIADRGEIASIIAALKPGRSGTVEPSDAEATKLWAFARRVLPVLVQAEAVVWEAQGKPLTPCLASLALALHQAEPGRFQFPNCACDGKYLGLTKCDEKPGKCCGRRQWLDEMRDRAVMPASVDTTQIITPQRVTP